MRYNQRELFQPQTFTYSNLGPKWTFDFLSYVTDSPNDPAQAVTVYMRGGGGQHRYWTYDAGTQSYERHWRTAAPLVRTSTSPIRYERRLPDGSVEVFDQPDGAGTYPRKVFLTEWRDAQGLSLHFTYDASLRLVAITDAIGQVTTLSYDVASDPLKITKVTDPFGRAAMFRYTAAGQLAEITDVIGLTSAFRYTSGSFVAALTTPYGTTTFRQGATDVAARWLEATDPLGGTERLEYRHNNTAIAEQAPAGEVPAGFITYNQFLNAYNAVYWDKLAHARAPGDVSQAVVTRWLRDPRSILSLGVPHSERRPLERRVWYAYPDQTSGPVYIGRLVTPAKVGRVLDNGTSQVSEAAYNVEGHVTSRRDSVGHETVYEYAPNGLDVVTVKQQTGAGWDVLETRTWNSQHQPLTITDAAGQTSTHTYNAAGQVLTVTNAKNETTTYVYDTNGRLQSITGPEAGATTAFTYDAYSRVRTVTDADGSVVTTDFDAFDRPTRTTYPDATYEQTVYDRLDVSQRRDRLGRVARMFYDPLRRLTLTRDPLGRTVRQEWCTCGSLEALVDANGNKTTWERDVQGRVTKEIRADSRQTLYAYEATTSRLKSVTDAKNQVATYNYFLDDRLKDIVYTNEQIATPDVSFTYDPTYGRLATMVDGTGTTAYGYHAVAGLGATRLASVDGPLTNDTITYSYDQLGRVTNRAIDGVGVTWSFDALGRVTTEVNSLGTFTYTYDVPTDRIATVAYPNGQTSTYSYYPNAQDHRLQTIHHQYPNAATLSKFDYTYNATGNILTWRQQADTTAVLWEYGYDPADQLTSAIKKATDPQQTVLKRYAYAYDLAGNRTIEQIDDQATGGTYNNVNELVTQNAVGGMVFEGTVNEPATVTIAGQPAQVSATNLFRGTAPVTAGTSTVTITATDGSGNLTTKQYEVSNTATAKTFTYDANGNLTADGTRTFEWDARNQLVAVNIGTHRSEFTYDGQQRRVRIVEKENSAVQSDAKVIWCDAEICEERGTDGTTVTRRAFRQGEQISGAARFFAPDHLGSVGDVTDTASMLLARYAFDPWGRRTLVAGTDVTTVGFTGHAAHGPSATQLALYRGYDADLARWISEDPIGYFDGPNVYRYSHNAPLTKRDPLGLVPINDPLVCAWKVAGRVGATLTGGDKYRHCVVACEITRRCGKLAAIVAGIGKEIMDIVGDGNAEWEDWKADLKGIECAEDIERDKRKKKTCEQRCSNFFR